MTGNDNGSPQQLVELALARSTADDCMVLVEEADRANIRWANNTLTTNGQTNSRRVTVISTVAGQAGTAVGVLSRAGIDADSLADLVSASESAARSAGPAADAAALVAGGQDDDWADPVTHTSIGVFGALAGQLGDAFDAARSAGHLLFGYAEHELTTTYLGTSTGLRRRHAQPTGNMQLNAKSR